MSTSKLNVTVFGLGEAGSLIAADLATAGVQVNGFDPRQVQTPSGVCRHQTARSAVQGTDVVLAVTASADAQQAMNQALDAIPENTLYVDCSTSAANLKTQLADQCKNKNLFFVDLALMSVVPGKGLKTPTLASGTGAELFSQFFTELGMPVEVLGENAGEASTRKLLRSVMMKGLAAVVIEAMEGAQSAGCSEWLWQNMADEVTRADEALLARLVRGTQTHARRRLHEMEASCELLQSLGVKQNMTQSTVESLRTVLNNGHGELIEKQLSEAKKPRWFTVLPK